MTDASRRTEQRLANDRNVWLATVRPDGRPHITPTWFVYLRERFWIGTGQHNVKTRNVTTNPSVSVALQDGDEPIVAEGIATVHLHERPDDVVKAFATKYDWDITVEHDADVGTVVLWEVEPRKWLFEGPD
ncbi:MAG: pyridoxamine 5'-phosphate oxidase family protein [Acidimicrobiales bacterium]